VNAWQAKLDLRKLSSYGNDVEGRSLEESVCQKQAGRKWPRSRRTRSSSARSRTTFIASSGCSTLRAGTPGLKMPALFQATSPSVVPSSGT